MPARFWRYLTTSLVIAVVLLPLTRQAIRTYPKIDDAGLELILKENGVHSVLAAQTNRPVVGWIIQKAALTYHLRPLGGLLQFTGWALFGLVAAGLWTALFPDKRQYAPLAAGLAIAPLLLKAQLMMWFLVVPVNLPVILAYSAGLLLWRYVRQGSRFAVTYIFVAGLVTFSAGMISEYGLLATLASSILLLSLVYKAERPLQMRVLQSILSLALTALCAHMLFKHTAEAHPAYGGVSFTPSLSDILSHLERYIVRFLRAFWFSLIGAYGHAIAITTAQTPASFSMVAAVYAFVLAGVLGFVCKTPRSSDPEPQETSWIRVAALVIAICICLAPAMLFPPLLVGRDLHMEEMSTRYYFVAAPLAVALTLRTLLALTRHRYTYLIPVLCGILIGSSIFDFVRNDSRNNQAMHDMSDALRPWVEGNREQIVVLAPDFYGRDQEMTEKITEKWPVALSRRLWVFWDVRASINLGHNPDRATDCKEVQFIDRNFDTIVRHGHIGNLLWLEPLPNGGFTVEPYCLGPHTGIL